MALRNWPHTSALVLEVGLAMALEVLGVIQQAAKARPASV